MTIPEYYDDVSIRLTEVLNRSGLGDDLRWWRINTWLQIEELERLFVRIVGNTRFKMCFFGSQPEATTTNELLSDIDEVYILNTIKVLRDLQFQVAGPEIEETVFMVADEDTPPGYAKLQRVQRDAPILVNNHQDKLFRLDSKRRSVLCSNTPGRNFLAADEYHGPASTVNNMGISVDAVFALHSHFWPDQASQWLSSRSRRHNWPTRGMIDVIEQTGFLLVPVGHKLSSEQHLEWRLSFSFGEKLLMMKFNSTQYKCYIMLKFIKNAFINVDVKEHLLTSYQCKTCMFYLIGNTPASLWHPYNLMLCIDLCLRQLLSWVECNNCPNYFIPEENMLLGRNLGPVKRHVAGILHDLLRQKGRYIRRIPYENIGENVLRVCQSLRMELDDPIRMTLKTTFEHFAHVVDFVCIAVANHNISNLGLFKLSHGIRQEAANIVKSLYCSSIGNHLASQCLEQQIPDQEKLVLANELLLLGSSSDVACGNLKLAAFYLVQNSLDKMEEVLNYVDDNFTNIFEDGNESTFSRIVHDDVSVAKLSQHYFALEVFHGPSDIFSIPKVLILEMFRSTGSEQGVDRLVLHWIPIAQISPRLYLYFLQFQCFHLQVQLGHTLIALYNMLQICSHTVQSLDNFLARTADVPRQPDFHSSALMYSTRTTTALNLLAYCLKQGNKLMDAFKVLCKSMKIKNRHNAAKWQIAFFINSLVRVSNVRQRTIKITPL